MPQKKKLKSFNCFTCGRWFSSREAYEDCYDHMMADHDGNMVFLCPSDGCHMYFDSEARRKVHEEKSHKKNITCPDCSKTFGTKGGLRDHYGIHTLDFTCPFCMFRKPGKKPKPYANNRILRDHVKSRHLEEELDKDELDKAIADKRKELQEQSSEHEGTSDDDEMESDPEIITSGQRQKKPKRKCTESDEEDQAGSGRKVSKGGKIKSSKKSS